MAPRKVDPNMPRRPPGRPTTDPKPHRHEIRLSDRDVDALNEVFKRCDHPDIASLLRALIHYAAKHKIKLTK